MLCKTRRDVMKLVKERNVSFIQFWFTDVLGYLKSFAITPSELEEGLSEGMGFDGSSIEGFARIEESDMIAKPDPTTFQFLPWRDEEKPVARMFCDILEPDGTPYKGDPRYVLKRLLQKVKDKGYTFYVGPELEFFYFAGVLKHAREISAITSQWVNSYKRLVPGYEAPVYVSWARRNRSTLVRVPMYKPGKEQATRIEFRSPDPACNPYLAFAVMLAAGLKGIEESYPLREPIEEDIYEFSADRRKALNIEELPGNLYEAITELEKSELIREALGNHIFFKFIENKKIEWDRFRIHVSQYEIEKYLPRL